MGFGGGGVGEATEVGAIDNRMGIEPDQLAFRIELIETGMGVLDSGMLSNEHTLEHTGTKD